MSWQLFPKQEQKFMHNYLFCCNVPYILQPHSLVPAQYLVLCLSQIIHVQILFYTFTYTNVFQYISKLGKFPYRDSPGHIVPGKPRIFFILTHQKTFTMLCGNYCFKVTVWFVSHWRNLLHQKGRGEMGRFFSYACIF